MNWLSQSIKMPDTAITVLSIPPEDDKSKRRFEIIYCNSNFPDSQILLSKYSVTWLSMKIASIEVWECVL